MHAFIVWICIDVGNTIINRYNHNNLFASVLSQDLEFLHDMQWSFFKFSELRLEVIVRFVDNGGTV
jgi:hypothetical protein